MIEKRYRAVLAAIQTYSGEDRIGHARRLCKAGLDSGTKPGSIQWMFTSRILADPKITGFCALCGINYYGKGDPQPIAVPCNVPGCPYESSEQQKTAISAEKLRDIQRAAALNA